MKDFKIIKKMLIFPLKTRIEINLKSKKLTSDEIRAIKKLYDACVASVDVVLKKMFSILEELGVLKNSYVIITSDHGEHLGDKLDHYFWEHNTYQSIYRSLMRVPLLIFHQDLDRKIINEQVQIIDLFHTILHLSGIPTTQNRYLELNKSIIHQINNNSTPKYIFGEYLKSEHRMLELFNGYRKNLKKQIIPLAYNHIYFLRTDESKYIKFNKINIEEYYNLLNDPYEKINIFNLQDGKCKELKERMKDFLKVIKNPDSIKELLTKKEKLKVKDIISRLKISEI